MKRMLIAIALAAGLLLTACGGGTKNAEPTTTLPTTVATVVATPPVATAIVQVGGTPPVLAESKYDETWARKQVEPQIKEMYELLLGHSWSKVYDMYPAEDREGCSRGTFVSKTAGNMLLLAAFGFNDDLFKAELQDIKDGKLVLTFSEITKDRITYMAEGDTEPTTIIRENGDWVAPTAYEPLGQDCSSLDITMGSGEETATPQDNACVAKWNALLDTWNAMTQAERDSYMSAGQSGINAITGFDEYMAANGYPGQEWPGQRDQGCSSQDTVIGSGEETPTAVPTAISVPAVETQVPAQICCKHCATGKACGDSCISQEKTCTKPAGCACN